MTCKYNLTDLINKFKYFRLKILHLYVEDGLLLFLFKGTIYEIDYNFINRYSTLNYLFSKSTPCK